MNSIPIYTKPRKGCIDIWKSDFVCGNQFTEESDMPLCPKTTTIPKRLVSYANAKTIYNKKQREHAEDFFVSG